MSFMNSSKLTMRSLLFDWTTIWSLLLFNVISCKTFIDRVVERRDVEDFLNLRTLLCVFCDRYKVIEWEACVEIKKTIWVSCDDRRRRRRRRFDDEVEERWLSWSEYDEIQCSSKLNVMSENHNRSRACLRASYSRIQKNMHCCWDESILFIVFFVSSESYSSSSFVVWKCKSSWYFIIFLCRSFTFSYSWHTCDKASEVHDWRRQWTLWTHWRQSWLQFDVILSTSQWKWRRSINQRENDRKQEICSIWNRETRKEVVLSRNSAV